MFESAPAQEWRGHERVRLRILAANKAACVLSVGLSAPWHTGAHAAVVPGGVPDVRASAGTGVARLKAGDKYDIHNTHLLWHDQLLPDVQQSCRDCCRPSQDIWLRDSVATLSCSLLPDTA